MRTALVTGATGLVGYNIVQSLLQRGIPVRALVRSAAKGRQLLPEACAVVEGDITDADSLEPAMDGCAMVYHAAGLPEQWLRDAQTFYHVNVDGTRHLIAAALRSSVERFIFTSTINVFQAKAGEVYREDAVDPVDRATPYEHSKQLADRAVLAAMQEGLPAVFVHPAAVYGPGPCAPVSPGINDYICKLSRGQIPALLPGGFPVVYGPDVGEGHVLAGERAEVGARYILSAQYLEMAAMAWTVHEELGITRRLPPMLPLPVARGLAIGGEWWAGWRNRPPMIARGQLHFLQWGAIPDAAKAERELGWRPMDFRSTVKPTHAFLTQAGGGC